MRLLSAIKGLFCKEYFIDQNSEATDPYLCGRMDIIEVYGAVGDGVTDDTAAFVAMAAAQDNIELPSDRVFLIGAITITKPRFTISGAGGMARIKAKAGTNADLITFDGSHSGGGYFRLQNVDIDGNKTNQTTGNGVLFKNASYTRCRDVVVHHCKLSGIEIVNHNQSSDADEVNITGVDCFFNDAHGISLNKTGSPTQGPGDHVISGCHTNYNGRSGIKGKALVATIIANNQALTNGEHGIHIDWAMRNIIQGNQCRNNGGCGIYLDSSLGNLSHSNTVIGNHCHYNNSAVSGAPNMNIWNQTRCIIQGNYCGDSDFTARAAYGIQLYQCIDARLVGNDFDPTHHVSGGVLVHTGGTGVTYVSSNNVGLADFPLASSTTTGPLSYLDWLIFNSKEGDLGSPPVSGRILSSTLSGIRSWIEANAHQHASTDITDGLDLVIHICSYSGILLTPVLPPSPGPPYEMYLYVDVIAEYTQVDLNFSKGVLVGVTMYAPGHTYTFP